MILYFAKIQQICSQQFKVTAFLICVALILNLGLISKFGPMVAAADERFDSHASKAIGFEATRPKASANKLNPTRPNILWITSEDNSDYWLGCYGNEHAQTPNLDAMAAQGLRFRNAYSNAAVCAVARSTLLLGTHAVTLGTHHMRSRYPIEEKYVPYVTLLRQAGYWCSNNAKTDFNFRGDDRAIWDECSRQAHYLSRPEGQPFFAIFNLEQTHESSLFPEKIEQNRSRGMIPPTTRVAPSDVSVPKWLPDCPEVRQDIAIYHDNMTAMDREVGRILEELESNGLAEDTIVFYFADHGGPTPRGKRYLEDSGVKVPLIIHIPERWQHLSQWQKNGAVVDEPVGFVDIAPTLLSLVGADVPEVMQGRPFLGTSRVAPDENDLVYLYADRFDDTEGMRRGITDGKFKYIRRFFPDRPAAPYALYAMNMRSWQAWKRLADTGKLSGYQQDIWGHQQATEEFFDLESDPEEIVNLANSEEHQQALLKFRHRLFELAVDYRDLGVIPENDFQSIAGDQPLSLRLREIDFDFEDAWRKIHLVPLEASSDVD